MVLQFRATLFNRISNVTFLKHSKMVPPFRITFFVAKRLRATVHYLSVISNLQSNGVASFSVKSSLNEVSKEGRKRWVQVLESNKNTPLKGDLIIILYGDVTMSRINIYVLYGTGIEQIHPIVVGFDTNCHYHHLYYNLLLLCCCYYLCSQMVKQTLGYFLKQG